MLSRCKRSGVDGADGTVDGGFGADIAGMSRGNQDTCDEFEIVTDNALKGAQLLQQDKWNHVTE